MSAEDHVKKALEDKFSFLIDRVAVKRERRIFADVSLENFPEVFKFVVSGLCFGFLSGITGLDNTEDFEVIYHLSQDGGLMLNLRTHLDHKNPRIPTVTGTFASAEAYERELADLLGIEIEGLAPGRRYPLPDEWPTGQHPLRKDWKPGEIQEEGNV